MDLLKEPTTNEEWRAYLYLKECDPLMAAAQAYEKEGDQTKADAMWADWTAKRAEIRTNYPDPA